MNNYYGRKDLKLGPKLLAFFGIVVVLLTITFFVESYYSEKNYTVTVTEKDIKTYKSDSIFLIFTKTEDGETRVFSMEDTLIKKRWDTADDYAKIEVGKTYNVTVIGWRIPFFSQYENIIKFEETD